MSVIKVTNRNLDDLIIEKGNQYVLEEGEYTLSKTIFVDVPCSIEGNKTSIKGNNVPWGFMVRSSDVTIKNLKLSGFEAAVEIDAWGKKIENILVENLYIDLQLIGVQVGSSQSNSTIKGVTVRNCFINLEGEALWEQNELAARLPFEIGAAVGRAESPDTITNCWLEDLVVENNTTKGPTRCAFNVILGTDSEFKLLKFGKKYDDNHIKNITCRGNNFDLCWDGPFNFICTIFNNGKASIENIDVYDNVCKFGIAGFYLYCGEPLVGAVKDGLIKGVKLHGNKLTSGVKDLGEPVRGVFITSSRVDYYPGCEVHNCIIEDVEIFDNEIDGGGIVIAGSYNMPDMPANVVDNFVRNVHVYNNLIKNTDYAFTFDGAQGEGRLYDWNFGYPRHEKRWGEDITDDSVITYHVENNQIQNLVCENNTIEGYRYRVTASGANLRGHGEAKNCKVSENIVFRNNKFGVGENHIHVANVIGEDFIHDAGGNEVSSEFLKK